jgi:hypothetical protein
MEVGVRRNLANTTECDDEEERLESEESENVAMT